MIEKRGRSRFCGVSGNGGNRAAEHTTTKEVSHMKKISALVIVSLLVILPLMLADMATAESYATPLPGSVATATEEHKIDLTPIFQAVIALLAAIITRKLIPWIKSKTTEKDQANLSAVARIAVYAAEQIYGAGHGDEKLDYAVEKLREWGFDLDAGLLKAAVESAVYGMNNSKTQPVAALQAEEGEINFPPVEEWSHDMLSSFCELNNIPHDGCVTREDYINAILKDLDVLNPHISADEPAENKSTEPPDVEAPVSENE